MEHKGYEIRLNKAFTNYSIHAMGKGALPKCMAGAFTGKQQAQAAIDSYVEVKEDKLIKEA